MDEVTECKSIHQSAAKCAFYLKTEKCHGAESQLDYMYFIFCYLQPQYSPAGIFLCILWLLFLFIGLGVTADDFLCPSLVVITKTLHLSQNIAGVTFLAFGNGSPDIFSSIAGVKQKRPDLVIGTLFGAGIFVTSVVAGSIFVTTPFKVMERPFLRDIIFYLLAAFWAFLRYYYQSMTLWQAVGFVALYIVYICVVIISRLIYSRYKKKQQPPVPVFEIQLPDPEPSLDRSGTMTTSLEQSRTKSISLEQSRTKSISLEPSMEADDPEAAGVVLRRFSFHSKSISLQKKRHSSVHSHHEHVIKAITQSFECHNNPMYINGHPTSLDTQMSKNSLSSLLSSNGEMTTLKEFIIHVFPIDVEDWREKVWYFKIFDIIKAPVCMLLILTVPVVDYENDKNNWCRPLNIIHLFSSPLFIMFAVKEYDANVYGFPIWAVSLIISFIVAIVVFYTSSNKSAPVYHFLYGYIGFATSVVWVYFLASEIVSLLQTIGVIFKLSDAILGLTVLAWGNSIGDCISNLSVARQGYPRMGISACYGGPLLNLLLGIGIPYIILIVKQGKALQLKYDKLITLLYGTLTFILLATIITMPINRFQAKRSYGIFLLVLYLSFLTTAILLESDIL